MTENGGWSMSPNVLALWLFMLFVSDRNCNSETITMDANGMGAFILAETDIET